MRASVLISGVLFQTMRQARKQSRDRVVLQQRRRLLPLSLGDGFSALSTGVLAALPAYALHRLGVLSEWHVAVFALLAAATVIMDGLIPSGSRFDRRRVRAQVTLVGILTMAACAGLLVVLDT